MNSIIVTDKQGIGSVVLNRPARHNAFNPEMIKELTEVFLRWEGRSDLRAILLRGEGPSFSAGGDLEWMKSMIGYSRTENLQDAQRLFSMYRAMAECSLPVIGQVHGSVMGGGLGLVAVCDWVVADERTQFSFSETRIGLAPAVISPFVLRKSPQAKLREVMLSARRFGVEEAKNFGLVHVACSSATDIGDATDNFIKQIFQCAPIAIREAKRLLNKLLPPLDNDLSALVAQVIAERRVSPEGQEGLQAFLEKREPSWR
jgi:methylglutaconyl-CoA hydratase